MSWRDRWNAWRFLCDLLEDGPEYFAQFCLKVEDPQVIEQVLFMPGKLMELCPARAMDISNLTVSGNLDAIANLLAQGRVGWPPIASVANVKDEDIDASLGSDKDEDDLSESLIELPAELDEVMVDRSGSSSSEEEESGSDSSTDGDNNDIAPLTMRDIAKYAVLFHGNLGTGERIAQVLQCRSIEKTPYNRYQFVIFVMGLFHLKMACTDTVWHILILPQLARIDATCVMKHVGILRRHKTRIISKDPGF